MSAPAHSTDLEQCLLGALIIDSDRMVDVVALITANDFYDPVHRDVFAAMVTLYEKARGFDLLTLSDELKNQQAVNAAGGSAYLAELTQVVPTGSLATRHAAMLRDKAIHRAVAAAGAEIAALGADEQLDANQVLDRAEQQIVSVSRIASTTDPETPYDIGKAAYERYAELHEDPDSKSLGIRSGFPALDSYLQGLEPGALVVIAARPSLGKTSLALNIAEHVARQDKPVAFLSLEMDKRQIFDRLLTSRFDLDVHRLRQGGLSNNEFQQLAPAIEQLQGLPLYVDDDCNTSLTNLRSKARGIKMQHGLELLIVDYLQLIEIHDRVAGDNRTQQVTFLSRSLKNLARELGCPIVALSQLNRAVENRSPAIPILSDLRDSGSIEQDADIVLMLYRESVYNEDCEQPHLTDVYIRKNRNGSTGRVSLAFESERMTFRTLTGASDPNRVAAGERSKPSASSPPLPRL